MSLAATATTSTTFGSRITFLYHFGWPVQRFGDPAAFREVQTHTSGCPVQNPVASRPRTLLPGVKMGTAFQMPHLALENMQPLHPHSQPQAHPSSHRQLSNPHVRKPAPFATTDRRPHAAAIKQSLAPMPRAPLTSQPPLQPGTRTRYRSTRSLAAASGLVLHSLVVPACISPHGGSLADFAAETAALFWFESTTVLERAGSDKMHGCITRAASSSRATAHFKKWAHTVLSTTQVGQNVVLLALMFVYRLKMANLTVHGRPGSEYRLLTVALMLGNKFLDDNNYTNKTWADVSNIPVHEIHIMEVEFLSNMRYSLLASKEQWEEWLRKLSRFYQHLEAEPEPSPTVSPIYKPRLSPLPAPSPLQAQAAPVLAMNGQDWHGLASASRKRALVDEEPPESSAKRLLVGRQQPASMSAGHEHVQLPRLGPPGRSSMVPSLTINTSIVPPQPTPTVPAHSYASYAPAQTSALSLPPLVPGIRAMSSVYATSLSTAAVPPSALTPSMAFPPPSFSTPKKRLSPSHPFGAYGVGSSPRAETLHSVGALTPSSQSPCKYLQQRQSPYKPVRHVNTLLYPPPSAFLQQYHLANSVPQPQLHYQPLGRRNDYHTGLVPEYSSHNHVVVNDDHLVFPDPHRRAGWARKKT